MLLKEKEGSNGVRTQANKARHPTTESPRKAFLATDITQKTHNGMAAALSRRSAHNASLNHVHRTADGSSHESSHERCCEVCAQVIGHAGLLDTHALEGIVRGELRGSHENRTGGVRPHSAEERTESLCLGHLHEPVECMTVVAALGWREGCVGLHADVHHIGWVTGDTTDEAGCAGHANQGQHARCGAPF